MTRDSTWTQKMRVQIAEFLQERLQARLDKLKEDDPKRADLIQQFQPAAWLEDATRRVRQIQMVTHSLKPLHPDARGTNLYIDPAQSFHHDVLGSHSLGADFAADVVGNAAALDVYKFLQLTVDGHSLLDGLLANDDAAIKALGSDYDKAREWQHAFASLVRKPEETVSSHVLAKQVYWLVGETDYQDATEDEHYHLLAPLHPTSLVHAVYNIVQDHRFGEQTKAARQARRNNEVYDGVLHEYPGLAAQKLGGTKPQNISQRNSERGGNNYLLSSLPPQWRSTKLRQPWHIKSIFESLFLYRGDVRQTVRSMRTFLQSDPPSNKDTRNRVDGYVSHLLDELIVLAIELQKVWPTGWTADARCDLTKEEQLWLDPERAESDAEFRNEWLAMEWPEKIGHRFGNWLNAQLGQQLPVGEVEQRHWKRELLLDESEGGWASYLHSLNATVATKNSHVTEGGQYARI